MVKPLPYGRQWLDDDDVAAVVAQLKSDWLTQGPAVERFEEGLCHATGARFCVAVANGTAALHLACLAAGVRSGDVGITAANTFVASANAVRYAGGSAHFADVEPSTGQMTAATLRAAMDAAGKPPKVIVPVDFAGASVDLPAIRELARSAGALVVEDAAHSLGSTYEHEGKSYAAAGCAHADMAILSFHPVKHITTGEGGAITTNDPGLASELRDLRTHGITKDPQRLTRSDGPWYYEQHTLGFNYRLTDLQSALGSSQLKKLERFVARRRQLAARYDAAFAAPPLAEVVQPLAIRAQATSSYHLYVVRLVDARRQGEPLEAIAARRRMLFDSLREQGISPQVHYIPVPRQPDFAVAAGQPAVAYPGADAYYASCISLPMFPAMQDEDVDRVVEVVRGALART
jgi:perosamine synthetase